MEKAITWYKAPNENEAVARMTMNGIKEYHAKWYEESECFTP